MSLEDDFFLQLIPNGIISNSIKHNGTQKNPPARAIIGRAQQHKATLPAASPRQAAAARSSKVLKGKLSLRLVQATFEYSAFSVHIERVNRGKDSYPFTTNTETRCKGSFPSLL
ncbi:hypothetical protein AVEN_216053-1 [Araneus ventricosus]|uniref:Uncharacterized protein n=1 Tax=Araneus ventricosus TaxID=182803 RepID=A0A4Y2MQ63_ARAVE|nr:hypothetical protein AVEN_216053-1 [Araneus ventricosus]